jgi:hypothetical protein
MTFKLQAANRLLAMNAKEAMKKDSSVYMEEDGGDWCIFGDSTGFCYERCTNKGEANQALQRWTRTLKQAGKNKS